MISENIIAKYTNYFLFSLSLDTTTNRAYNIPQEGNDMNRLRRLVEQCDIGRPCGIASYCTANELVIEACMEQALRFDDDVLIETTANQVNQYGGYTGMTPLLFKQFVLQIADRIGFPKDKVILGGDHLGPLVWQNEDAPSAMAKAEELVTLFVEAGYQKIHLDTSMRLASDPADRPLPVQTAAQRGAALFLSCMKAFERVRENTPDAERPVFVIGSEVPVPGGAQGTEDTVTITRPEALLKTVENYREAFSAVGVPNAFQDVIAVVVQPGVEFSDDRFVRYNRTAASALTTAARGIHGLVLEGHSTDYQPAASLKEMVEDGVGILKVGPALTFSLREALFSLSHIEQELIPEEQQVHLIETLDKLMLQDPGNWERYYSGTEKDITLKRKYSFSDRCRYYFSHPLFTQTVQRLFDNLDGVCIPLNMLHQFMPEQYYKVRDGKLPLRARSLAKDKITCIIENYNYATHHNYMIANVLYN